LIEISAIDADAIVAATDQPQVCLINETNKNFNHEIASINTH
jgi:hypothetical protein